MMKSLKRLLACLLALTLCSAALAEEMAAPELPAEAPVEAPAEAPVDAPVDAPVETMEEAPTEMLSEEIGEIDLPVEDPAPEPAVEPAPEPVMEPAPEPAVEPAPETIMEVIPEPLVEADPDALVAAPEPFLEADPDAMVAAPGDAPVLLVSSLVIGAKDKVHFALANGYAPAALGAVFTSSNPKIATVDNSGLLTAKKAGVTTVTADVGGVVSSCEVTAVKAPKKVILSAKKLELGAGEAALLGVTLSAADAVSAITFTSSNPGVAAVDAGGVVVGVAPGTATVTASTYNGKKAKCKVTVKAAPTTIAANVGALSLWLGRLFPIEPILSPGSGGSVWLTSSNPGVVAVEGLAARAVGMGSATLTLSTYNGLWTEIPVNVTKAPVYRALLIGEGTFPDTGMADLPGRRDVALMEKMLRSVQGPSGEPWQIQTATDLTAVQIHSAIQSAFAGAEPGDVSLFYISSHGDEELDINGIYSSYAGYLLAYPDYRYENWYDRNALTLGRLAGWLCEVPGQVVVIIDSCGSGAAIYGAAVSAPAISAEDFDPVAPVEVGERRFSPEAFDRVVVNAFQTLDTGVLAAGSGAFVLENKFFVLTSAGYRESGWSVKNKYSFFTKWLTDAVKTKGRMPADADRNRITTLNELFNRIKKAAAKKVIKYEGVKYKQHVQVYPGNSGFELFFR